ncbi:hypothetical protein ALC57_10793 [Trachymyrmex cornetzi]|uniref:Uncharacterized protein n=1 Tax=Trachymyrmex cornetzi TaxID=471704 RepID=A0A151J3D4_9HYME|nr:hypothetical protein ALC57_10793 [Trachymyrmex cornetzi]
MVSKTSRFALLSDSFICSYYHGGVGACERARGGGRARKTGIQLAGTALTDRLDPPPWVRLYFKYLYALASRQWTMPLENGGLRRVVQRGGSVFFRQRVARRRCVYQIVRYTCRR